MRKLGLLAAWIALATLGSLVAAPRKPATAEQLAAAAADIAGLDKSQQEKVRTLLAGYIADVKGVKTATDRRKIDGEAWIEWNAILNEGQKKKVWAYVDRENKKELADRQEDIQDKLEDQRDKAEDRKDRNDKKKMTPAQKKKDRAEDKKDKAEDKKDKAEDKKDKLDDIPDAKDELRYWLNRMKAAKLPEKAAPATDAK